MFLQTTADTGALGKNLPIVGTTPIEPFVTSYKLHYYQFYQDRSIFCFSLSFNGGSGQIQFNFNFQEALTEHAVDLDFESGIIDSTLIRHRIKSALGSDLT